MEFIIIVILYLLGAYSLYTMGNKTALATHELWLTLALWPLVAVMSVAQDLYNKARGK